MVLSLFASDSYDDWPRPLRKLGYVVRVIEGTIENSWRSIKPDIVAVAGDDGGTRSARCAALLAGDTGRLAWQYGGWQRLALLAGLVATGRAALSAGHLYVDSLAAPRAGLVD